MSGTGSGGESCSMYGCGADGAANQASYVANYPAQHPSSIAHSTTPPSSGSIGPGAAVIMVADNAQYGPAVTDWGAANFMMSAWFTRLQNLVNATSALKDAIKTNDDLLVAACAEAAYSWSSSQGMSVTDEIGYGANCYGTLNVFADSSVGRKLVAQAASGFNCVEATTGFGLGPATGVGVDRGDPSCNYRDAHTNDWWP